jgi:hypothetical protein
LSSASAPTPYNPYALSALDELDLAYQRELERICATTFRASFLASVAKRSGSNDDVPRASARRRDVMLSVVRKRNARASACEAQSEWLQALLQSLKVVTVYLLAE